MSGYQFKSEYQNSKSHHQFFKCTVCGLFTTPSERTWQLTKNKPLNSKQLGSALRCALYARSSALCGCPSRRRSRGPWAVPRRATGAKRPSGARFGAALAAPKGRASSSPSETSSGAFSPGGWEASKVSRVRELEAVGAVARGSYFPIAGAVGNSVASMK